MAIGKLEIRESLDRLVTAPGEELGRWARLVRFQVQLWQICARRLWENNVMAMSAALSFRTIFALVPILVLGFIMLKSVGALDASKEQLRQLLATSGFAQITLAPESAEATDAQSDSEEAEPSRTIDVAGKIEELVTGVESKLTLGRVGPVGVIVLVWTAMTLVGTLERSLNRIFEAKESRSWGRRLLLYWTAVTLGPVALSAAVFAGARAISAAANLPVLSWLLVAFGWLAPMVVGLLFVASLYKLMPNTHVSVWAAVGGAMVSVPLWLLAKWGFGIYVSRLVGTGNLYGTLGLLPLFLVWLNLSWWIFLFGAQLSYAAMNLGRIQAREQAENKLLDASDLLACAVAIGKAFAAGQGPMHFAELVNRLQLPNLSIHRLIEQLSAINVVCLVDDAGSPAFVLARPTEKIPVLEILAWDRQAGAAGDKQYEEDISTAVSLMHQQARENLGTFTLADLLSDSEAPPSEVLIEREFASTKHDRL